MAQKTSRHSSVRKGITDNYCVVAGSALGKALVEKGRTVEGTAAATDICQLNKVLSLSGGEGITSHRKAMDGLCFAAAGWG